MLLPVLFSSKSVSPHLSPRKQPILPALVLSLQPEKQKITTVFHREVPTASYLAMPLLNSAKVYLLYGLDGSELGLPQQPDVQRL